MKILNLHSLKTKLKAYGAVLGITCACFIFNSSEFIPIGILSLIAQDFKLSEAAVGLIITFYAWVVAIASLPLMLLTSKIELKRLLLGVLALFVVAHIFSTLANSMGMLIFSRLLVATAHSIFWSIASVMAVRAAPKGGEAIALSLVLVGTTTALVLGLPLGRVIGLYLGWRMTFLSIGVVALLVWILLFIILPKMPSNSAHGLKSLPNLLENKAFRHLCFLTLLFITAHFTTYSYVEPFLALRFSEEEITFVLVLFGAMGFVGGVLFSKLYEKRGKWLLNFALFGLSLCLLLFYPFLEISTFLILLLCCAWGLALALIGLMFQALVIKIAPQSTTIAMSIYSGTYNVGIGSGAFIGGLVYADFGITYIGFIGAFIALLGCLLFVKVKFDKVV